MKKVLSLVLILVMVLGSFTFAFADSTKYDALIESGLFGQGGLRLDQPLTRAQFALVALRASGYTDAEANAQGVAANFKDVPAGHFYSNYIGLAQQLGLVVGSGDNFNPSVAPSYRQVIAVLLRILGHDTVTRGASYTDGTMINFAKELGFNIAGVDVAAPATRSVIADILVDYLEIKTPAQLQVVSVSAINPKALKVTFNKAVENTTAAIFAVRRGNVVVGATPEWNTAKTEVTLTAGIALTAGEYTVTVTGLDIAEGKNVATTLVAPERVERIEIAANGFRQATPTDVKVAYKVFNQYNQDITANIATADFNASASRGTSATVTAAGEITLENIAIDVTNVSVTLVDKTFGKVGTATVAVRDRQLLDSVTLSQPVIPTGATALSRTHTNVVIPYNAVDQYGGKVTLANTTALTFISSNTTALPVSKLTVTPINAVDQLVISDFPAFNGAQTITLTVIVNATGKSHSITFTVNGTSTADAPSLVAPTANPGVGENPFRVELKVTDNFGAEMTAANIAAIPNTGITITSGNASVFTVVGDTAIAADGKAYVRINPIATGTANLTVTINATGKSTTIPVTVVPAKYAATMTLVPDFTLAANGGVVTVKATFRDQYGNAMTTSNNIVRLNANNTHFGTVSDVDRTVTQMVETGITLTAADWDKTTVLTAQLTNTDAAFALANVVDTKTFTVASVKADAALTYEVEALGTIATAGAAYDKDIKVFATLGGAKVAIPANAVVNATSSNTAAATIQGSAPNFAVRGVGTVDATVTISVTVNTNTGVRVLTAPVNVSKEAPVPVSIVAKTGTATVTTATLTAAQANAPINLATSSLLKFVVTDQYGKTELTNDSNVTVFIRNNTTGAVTKATTLANHGFTFVAGTTYTLTAVTNNGLSAAVTVTVTP